MAEHKSDASAGWGGGVSEHVVVPRYAVYHLPETISLEVGGKIILSVSDCADMCRSTRRTSRRGLACREDQSFPTR